MLEVFGGLVLFTLFAPLVFGAMELLTAICNRVFYGE